MKRAFVMLLALSLALVPGLVSAEEDAVEKAVEACMPEIENYCSQVTLGDNRLLACFYAHEDKLSGQCSWALYEAAEALEDFAVAVSDLWEQCYDDAVEHCGEVEMGEGRVAVCLLDHKADVSTGCQQAMDDADLQVE